MSKVQLNDTSHFQLISGLWKGERAPLKPAKVLRATNFGGDGLINFGDVVEVNVEERLFPMRQLLPGDIVVERSGGGPRQPVGRVALFNPPDEQPYFSSNFTTALRIRDQATLDPSYAALHLHALYLDGATETLQRGTTGIRNLDWQEYLQLEIPLRPIEEQKWIARLIAGVRTAYRVEGDLLGVLGDLKRATMTSLFTRGLRDGAQKETEFGPVPTSWILEVLDRCATVQTGAAKGRHLAEVETIEVPYLRVANVQDGHLDLTEMKRIKIRRSELDRYRLKVGDVVLTEGGDFDKLGRGFIWRGELETCIHQNHVFAVRPDTAHLLPEFFAYLAQSAYGKAYFLKVAHKTTNLACINSTKLKAFPVIYPRDLDEQREIVAILEAIDHKIALHQQKRAVLQELFKSLLHKLVTDEIPINDRNLSAPPECTDSRGVT